MRAPLVVGAYFVIQFLTALLTLPIMAILVLSWCAVVLTGRHPRVLFNASHALLKWTGWCSAYVFLLTDAVPWPWELDKSPVRFDVLYPQRSSRSLALARIVTCLPGYVALLVVSIAALALLPIVWALTICSGRHAAWFFRFHEGAIRWNLRLTAYIMLLRDEYPPYSTQAEAPRSSNKTAFVLGILFPIVVVGIVYALLGAGMPRGSWGSGGRTRDDDDEYVTEDGYVVEKGALGGFSYKSGFGGPERDEPHGNPSARWGDEPLYRR
jgi:hypothetical protein